ncbi:hypothetical protein C3F09_04095, partial [candidate division GN15 bacterium]
WGVALVALFLVGLGCYSSNSKGTLILYRGDRLPVERVARIVVSAPGLWYSPMQGAWMALKDTLEVIPGSKELLLGRMNPKQWPMAPFETMRYRRSGSGPVRKSFGSGPSIPRKWRVSFRAIAGHLYELKLSATMSDDQPLILVDHTTDEISFHQRIH